MIDSKKRGVGRPLAVLGLVAGIAFCLPLLRSSEKEIADFAAATRPILEDRARLYAEHRKADGWSDIYEMVYPGHRRALSRNKFLRSHQHGLLETLSLEVTSCDINEARRTATTTYAMEARMRVAHLPSRVRGSLRITDPEQLLRKTTFDLRWIWRDGDWYFLLERELISRKDSQGNPVSLFGPQSR